MFAGHIGAALLIGRAQPRMNVGVLVVAALWLDILLWAFILLGWESVRIPPDFAATHQPEFVFPWSHGLVAAAGWSLAAGAIAASLAPSQVRWQAGIAIAAAVFSHWLLDALVHRPEMPLVGDAAVGLALWDRLPIALAVETALVLLGLRAWLPRSGLRWGPSVALAGLSLVAMALTAVGMTLAPPPPSTLAMAASSLATLLVLCAVFLWLGRAGESRNPQGA